MRKTSNAPRIMGISTSKMSQNLTLNSSEVINKDNSTQTPITSIPNKNSTTTKKDNEEFGTIRQQNRTSLNFSTTQKHLNLTSVSQKVSQQTTSYPSNRINSTNDNKLFTVLSTDKKTNMTLLSTLKLIVDGTIEAKVNTNKSTISSIKYSSNSTFSTKIIQNNAGNYTVSSHILDNSTISLTNSFGSTDIVKKN